MDTFDKLALEAIERSKSRTYTPQDPFVSFGFKSNPFLETSIEELQQEDCIKSRFSFVIEYISIVYDSFQELLNNEKNVDNVILDGVLFGTSQSGMSTLISLSYQFLTKHHKNLSNSVYADAYDLVEYEDNHPSIAKTFQNFRNYIGRQSKRGDSIPLLIIDHADFLVDYFEDFRFSINRDFQSTPIIFIFSQSGWTRLKNELMFSDYDLINHMVPAQRINPLNEDEILEILTLKLSKKGQIQNPFTQKSLKLISKNASGSLINAIKICARVCEECYYNGQDVASLALVNDMTTILGIDVNKEFYDLITLNDNTQTFVLSLISMKSIANDFGITYDDIVNNLGIQKTSASHHLKQLQERRYLIKKTVNRKAFYRLKDELKTLADTYLMKSFEQKDTHVRLESISDLI